MASLALLLACGPSVSPVTSEPALDVEALTLDGDERKTRVAMTLTSGVPVSVFTLADPYRLVVDLPKAGFRLPADSGRKGKGLVAAYRFGLFAADRSRVVLDTRGPVLIESADMVALAGGRVRLDLVVGKTDAAIFGAGTGPSRDAASAAKAPPANANGEAEAQRARSAGRQKPVIVIDPGHGGIDPGALGSGSIYEKDLVLEVARRIAGALRETGRYDVHMTRSSDVFVALGERLRISQQLGSDLFISLHADALADTSVAASVRGATVYTLAERASDRLAQQMADKENAADLIAGLDTASMAGQDDVRDILFDLLQRETATFASDFSAVLLARLKAGVRLARDPQRSASFKVLKQANTPAVLVELGYLSNPEDERTMRSEAWQRDVTAAMVKAIGDYFARRRTATR
ncbi:MAG: N-acetylmuramoyl-L-alanine amidase [Hyphomicrobiaceae bacterium]|nr:N-acetylmuramoyl-L-alanine amidase [Hyphomicrobiaceae bacterium]